MQESDYPTCKRTYATLRIYPERFDPTEVTARLRLEPSKWQRRGETQGPGLPPGQTAWLVLDERRDGRVM